MNEEPITRAECALLDAWLKTAPAGAPNAEQLADWLAGRLDEAAAVPIERALAQDAGLRAALLALREGAMEIAPADEVARVRALAPGSGIGAARRWRYAVAASLLLVAGGLGWMMGSTAAGEAADRVAVSAADVFGSDGGL